MAQIELRNLTKRFGDLEAVSDVSVTVEDGELLCLLGPSGCGKSTTLRMIGGLERPTDGEVYLGNEDVTDTAPYNRDTSIVFQDWELFPHKSVIENVAFGLKMRNEAKDERRERAREMLDRVEMAGYEDHDPTDLSGGQKQRVALARSLAVDPDVLLLDEPLSNLDKRLREQMEIELKEIHEDLEKTFIYVTHNQDEAFTLADRIGIMNQGELIQVGEPSSVYQNPKNQFIEEFLGDTNFVTAEVRDGNTAPRIETDFGATFSAPGSVDLDPNTTIMLSLRPEFLRIEQRTDATEEGTNPSVRGIVDNVLYRGSTVRYFVDVANASLFVERHVGNRLDLTPGTQVELSWTPQDLLMFRKDGSRIQIDQ